MRLYSRASFILVATAFAMGAMLSYAGLLLWVVAHFSLISGDRSQSGEATNIAGRYKVEFMNEWSDSSPGPSPFSNGALTPELLEITQGDKGVDVYHVTSKGKTFVAKFRNGETFFWRDGAFAEFSRHSGDEGAPIGPALRRSRIEGFLRIQANGDIFVEKIYWQRGLAFFVFPGGRTERQFFILRKVR